MYTLVTFATQWGSRLGGINSFNTDLLSAFGVAYHLHVKTICIVATATAKEIQNALDSHVLLHPLPYPPIDKKFSPEQAHVALEDLNRKNIDFDPERTVWLGHDLISGAAANEAARIAGGRSALIHHMSYDHYESFAENSAAAYEKTCLQTTLFQQADIVLAVGPLLRDALNDRLGESKKVSMLVPGLAEIDLRPTPRTFTAFLSGRLSENAAKIKQGHLGIAAFSKAQRDARISGMPDGLLKQPKLILRGVDFDCKIDKLPDSSCENPETALKLFAEDYAEAVINLHALPYTLDRQTLYRDLSGASVALMPSWHEGFGLVAWEAIAAGVPLIVSKNSGVYQLLEEVFPGDGTGCVFAVDIQGSVETPFFRQEDLKTVVDALTTIANNPDKARQKAGRLRSILGNYTWSACATQVADALQWTLHKGSMPAELPFREPITPYLSVRPTLAAVSTAINPLQMPTKQWRASSGMAYSQLLRAEEAQVPFDLARQPALQDADNWLDNSSWPLAVRLITGAGGLGKTRLALELCNQRLAQGWRAGFLDNNCSTENIPVYWERLRNLNQPLLIVIDYAETRQTVLLSLVKSMLKNPGNKQVRVLLLARNGGEWWDNLPGYDPFCEALLSGYATSGPFRLPPLYLDTKDRNTAYQRALQTFARSLNISAPDVVPEMSGEHFARPLYVQMAALLTLHGERPTTAEGLTKALLNHERRYWRGCLRALNFTNPEGQAQKLLALATLAGGFSTSGHAKPYWLAASNNSATVGNIDMLFHALVPLYPGKQGLQSVRPDLLGEALVGQSLLRDGAELLLDAVLSKGIEQPVRRHALTVLARLSSQRPDLFETLKEALIRNFAYCYHDILTVAVETVGNFPQIAVAAFDSLPIASKSQLAGLLEPLLEHESVRLADLYCAVAGFLVEKARKKYLYKKKNIDCKTDYARTLANYSLSLKRAGCLPQALMNAQKSLNISNELYGKNSKRFAPEYAMSLTTVANRLRDFGRYEEGLSHAKQALELYKRLTKDDPNYYESDYTRSLGNVGALLSEVGRYEEGLSHAEQSLEIYKRLAQNDPNRYESEYARTLGNVGSHLSEAGRYEEGLSHAEQTLEIYKLLAKNNPDRYELDYARSLDNVGSHLSNVGRYEEGLSHSEQALEIFELLAQNNPDRYESEYARSLGNVGSQLTNIGRYKEGLTFSEQAIEIYKQLVVNYPERFEALRFNYTAEALFMAWLANNQDNEGNSIELLKMPELAPLNKYPEMHFVKHFLNACCFSDKVPRSDKFKQVITGWGDLSLSIQNRNKSYWLCSTAWCAAFSPEIIKEMDWLTDWRKFKGQNKGRIPLWMQETAKKLSFEFPQ